MPSSSSFFLTARVRFWDLCDLPRRQTKGRYSPKPDIAGLLSMLAYEFSPRKQLKAAILAPGKQREEKT